VSAPFLGLIRCLEETRALLTRPGTTTVRSSWDSVAEALEYVSVLKARATVGDPDVIREAKLLFAPTGDLQEVAMGSGWEGPYIELATRFDRLFD
jgi:hypothetical protein